MEPEGLACAVDALAGGATVVLEELIPAAGVVGLPGGVVAAGVLWDACCAPNAGTRHTAAPSMAKAAKDLQNCMDGLPTWIIARSHRRVVSWFLDELLEGGSRYSGCECFFDTGRGIGPGKALH